MEVKGQIDATIYNASGFGVTINAAAAKTTPIDADMLALMDSVASNILTKLSWADVKTMLGAIYAPIAGMMYIGTTAVALNRASANLALTGITGITPTTDFTLIQNGVIPFTSVEVGAIVNTLYLNAGNVGVGKIYPNAWSGVSGVGGVNVQIYSSTQARLIINAASLNPELHLVAGGNAANDRNYRFIVNADSIELNQPADDYSTSQQLMTWTKAGDIGIGTSTPAQKLDIVSGIIRLSNNYQIEWGGSADMIYMSNASHIFSLLTNSVERITVLGSGNIGFGTTAPFNYVSGSINTQIVGVDYSMLTFGVSSSSTDNKFWRHIVRRSGLGGPIYQLQSVDDSGANEATALQFTRSGNSITKVLLPNGDVGIGTVTPDSKLTVDVVSNAYANDYGSFVLRDIADTTRHLSFGIDNTLGALGAAYIRVVKSGADVMPLLLQPSGGNVGIGTTIPGLDVTAGRNYVTIKGSTDRGVLQLTSAIADADGTPQGNIEWVDSNSTNTHARVAHIVVNLAGATAGKRGSAMLFGTKPDNSTGSPVERMRIDNAGNIGIGVVPTTGQLQIARDVPQLVGLGHSQLILQGLTDLTKQLMLGFETTNNYAYIQPLHSGVGWGDYNLALCPVAGSVGIGTIIPLQPLHVAKDMVYAPSRSGQIYAGSEDGVKRLMLGYDTTNNFGFLEGIYFGNSYSDICINPVQGNVYIGKTTGASKFGISGLPTSVVGLSAGDIWVDTTGGLNILKIV